MIDPLAQSLALKFSTDWKKLFSFSTAYQLDLSPQSLGLVDTILRPLRGKKQFSESDEQLIREASAYLASLLYATWADVLGARNVNLKVTEQPVFDVIVETTVGEVIPEQGKFSALVTSNLRTLLQKNPSPFLCFSSWSAAVFPWTDLITLYMTGALCGLSPMLKSTPRLFSPSELGLFLNAVSDFLARRSSEHFARRYPSDMLIQDPVLFQAQLLLPPLGYDELYPGMRAITGLHDYFEAHEISTEDRLSVTKKLLHSTHQSSALLGFMYLSALAPKPTLAELEAFIRSRGSELTVFRPAVLHLRTLLGREANWYSVFLDGNLELAVELFEEDVASGLIPLAARCEPEVLTDQRFALFYEYLSWGKLTDASDYADVLLASIALPPALLLQKLEIDLLLGKLERVESILSTWPEGAKPKTLETNLWLAKIRAELLEQSGNSEGAAAVIRAAFLDDPPPSIFVQNLFIKLLHLEFSQQNYKEVKTLCSALPQFTSIVSKIVLFHSRLALGESISFADTEPELKLLPTHEPLLWLCAELHAQVLT